MIRAFLSDRGKGLKLAGLGAIALALSAWSIWFYPAQPPQHERAARWRDRPQDYLGRRVDVKLAPVEARLPDGSIAVRVGPGDLKVRLINQGDLLKEARIGGMVEAAGRLIGPMTIKVERVRIHTGGRKIKVYGSLAAALAALGLFWGTFRIRFEKGAIFWPRKD